MVTSQAAHLGVFPSQVLACFSEEGVTQTFTE